MRQVLRAGRMSSRFVLLVACSARPTTLISPNFAGRTRRHCARGRLSWQDQGDGARARVEGIKNAIRAGVHSIEAWYFLDDEAVEMMIARGIFLVPTLLAPVAVVESADSLPDYAREQAMESWKFTAKASPKRITPVSRLRWNRRRRHAARHQFARLELMVNVGVTPMDAIIATTRTAAECLGWQDKVGTLTR